MDSQEIGFDLEKAECERFRQKGKTVGIAGVDEAGRGPLAGPVVAAAVIFPIDWVIHGSLPDVLESGINDSKKLTPKKRENLFKLITNESAIIWAIGESTPEEIDQINILCATKLAMERAVQNLEYKNELMCLVDGLPLKPSPFKHKSVVKGDAKSFSIAAASILAKVFRDQIMTQCDLKYPNYRFGKHKGYGTKEHLEAIQKFGPCKIHRKSFAPIRQDQLDLF